MREILLRADRLLSDIAVLDSAWAPSWGDRKSGEPSENYERRITYSVEEDSWAIIEEIASAFRNRETVRLIFDGVQATVQIIEFNRTFGREGMTVDLTFFLIDPNDKRL